MAGTFLDSIFQWVPQGRKADQTLTDIGATSDGAMKVAIVATSDSSVWINPAPGAPLTASRVIAALPKGFLQVLGTNEGASDRWFMMFDSATVPANGTEPMYAFKVPLGQPFSLELTRPRAMLSGIAWAISSTASTLTLDATATFRVSFEVSA